MTKIKIKPVRWREVGDSKYSTCDCALLEDLDFKNFWSDSTNSSIGMFYLHVKHKNQDTYHRVYCRRNKNPRIGMAKGKLYWLY